MPPPSRPPDTTTQTAETARYKLGRITSDDGDGYHRVMCPAVMGKIRCPLRPAIDDPGPGPARDPHPARSIRRPAAPSRPSPSRPGRAAKTRQKHDYPSAAHRRSYARRTGAERTFSTTKDPATNNITRGWTRLMGLTPLTLWLACLLAVRNHRILDRLERPPGRRRPPRRGRPAPQNPAPAPQDPRQPRHRSAAITLAPPIPRPSPARPRSPRPQHTETTCCPEQPRRPGNQPRTRLQPRTHRVWDRNLGCLIMPVCASNLSEVQSWIRKG